MFDMSVDILIESRSKVSQIILVEMYIGLHIVFSLVTNHSKKFGKILKY